MAEIAKRKYQRYAKVFGENGSDGDGRWSDDGGVWGKGVFVNSARASGECERDEYGEISGLRGKFGRK